MRRTTRPSVDAVAAALADPESPVGRGFGRDGVKKSTALCIATVLHDSELSDEALVALVDGDDGFEGTTEDQAAILGVTAAIAACLTG